MTPYERTKEWRSRPENKGKRTEEGRRYRAKHREEVNARRLEWKRKNIEHVRAQDAENARKRRADPEGNRRRVAEFKARQLKKREDAAGRARPTACELCGEQHPKIVWDHCHKLGHFRGWICDRCNKVLGLVKDSTELLALMREYLIAGATGDAKKTEVSHAA